MMSPIYEQKGSSIMSERKSKEEVYASLEDGLIVSCQATPAEPHYMPGITTM